jgi:hypothetical protein
MIRRLVSCLAVLTAVSGSFSGCRHDSNAVADYLTHAELQYETEGQKQSVIRALNDILALTGPELQQRRYDDYSGQPNTWDLPTLISRYFAPDRKGKTLGPRFYSDVKSARVQAEVRRILDRLSGVDSTGQ